MEDQSLETRNANILAPRIAQDAAQASAIRQRDQYMERYRNPIPQPQQQPQPQQTEARGANETPRDWANRLGLKVGEGGKEGDIARYRDERRRARDMARYGMSGAQAPAPSYSNPLGPSQPQQDNRYAPQPQPQQDNRYAPQPQPTQQDNRYAPTPAPTQSRAVSAASPTPPAPRTPSKVTYGDWKSYGGDLVPAGAPQDNSTW